MQTITRDILHTLKIVILALALSIGLSYLHAAWSPPTATPPAGNTPAPVNVGSTAQSKAGWLGVNKTAAPLAPFDVVGRLTTDQLTVYGTDPINGLIHTNSGNVGIGTVSPGAKLEVSGNIKLTGDASISNGAGNLQLNSAATLYLNNNANSVRIATGGGNVGIGTAAPGAKLDVDAGTLTGTQTALRASQANATGWGLVIGNDALDTTNYRGLRFKVESDGDALIESYTALPTAPAYRNILLAPSGGNVGIGTADPATKLHIFDGGSGIAPSLNFHGIIVDTNSNGGNGIEILTPADKLAELRFGSAAPLGAVIDWGGVRNTFDFNGLYSDAIIFKFQFTEIMRIVKATGNVGIGTSNPTAKLYVAGDAVFRTANIDSGPNPNAELRLLRDGVMKWNILNDGVDGNKFKIKNFSGATVLTILGNSAVGIGTENPGVTFEVAGVIATTQFVSYGPGNNYFGGMVGIGKTPTTALDVQGTITGTTKNFQIAHPIKDEMDLVHSSLEGPEHAVYYRGTTELFGGEAVVQLPDYFEFLTREEGRTVTLTNIDGFDSVAVKTQDGKQIMDGRFTVYSNNPVSAQKFNWEVKAVRADVPPLEAEVPQN